MGNAGASSGQAAPLIKLFSDPRGVGSGPLGVSCGVWHQALVAESSSPVVWEVGPPWTGLVLAHPTEVHRTGILQFGGQVLVVTLLRPFLSSFVQRCT